MTSSDKKSIDISELIALLNEDRSLILEQIDQGEWPEIREELAALERDLGYLLNIAAEKITSAGK